MNIDKITTIGHDKFDTFKLNTLDLEIGHGKLETFKLDIPS